MLISCLTCCVPCLSLWQLTGCIRLTDDGNAFPMVAMAVVMTAAMTVARRWRSDTFIVIGDIKGVKWHSAPEYATCSWLPCCMLLFRHTLVFGDLFCLYRVLKYYSNVEFPPDRPHAKIDFFIRLVSFFATAHIFFATACKNWPDRLRLKVTPHRRLS